MSLEPGRGFSVTQHVLCPLCEKIVEESQPYEVRDDQLMHVGCAEAVDHDFGEHEPEDEERGMSA